jgi:hypothetical protein
MKKAIRIISVIMMILFVLSACKKKEEQPVPQAPAQGPIIDSPSTLPGGHGMIGQKIEFEVVVPPEVKEKWSAVKLIVNDNKLNEENEFTVAIGDELKIPDSDLSVKVGPFFPDFKMSGQIITSASNEANNPSAGIKVFAGEKLIFPESGEWGWLYSKFPTIHPFQHERFELKLKEGVEK